MRPRRPRPPARTAWLWALVVLAGPSFTATGAPAPYTVPCSGGTCVAVALPPELAATLAERHLTDADWRRAFAVRTEEAATSDAAAPPLFGTYTLTGKVLLFRPRLPFLPAMGYRATADLAALRRLAAGEGGGSREGPASPEAELELRFRLDPPSRETPRVVSIHPTAGRVPGNLLRAYVEFSRPMRPDVVADYLRLVDATGREVPLPFVEIDGGLWDPRQTRLTLLFHPGRLKRGVAPRQRQGPPLVPGETYRLLVAPGWPAATGEPLTQGTSRTWEVGPEDRTAVTPDAWRLTLPRAGTDEPLQVEFGEALDHALALRLISVLQAGEPVPGEAGLSAGGGRWSFRPAAPWRSDDYLVHVHPALEDLAGNNLRGVFDRDAEAQEGAALAAELPFRPRRATAD